MPFDIGDTLFTSIDERRDELVELTRRLIQFPTVSPPAAARVYEGLKHPVVAPPPGALQPPPPWP